MDSGLIAALVGAAAAVAAVVLTRLYWIRDRRAAKAAERIKLLVQVRTVSYDLLQQVEHDMRDGAPPRQDWSQHGPFAALNLLQHEDLESPKVSYLLGRFLQAVREYYNGGWRSANELPVDPSEARRAYLGILKDRRNELRDEVIIAVKALGGVAPNPAT